MKERVLLKPGDGRAPRFAPLSADGLTGSQLSSQDGEDLGCQDADRVSTEPG